MDPKHDAYGQQIYAYYTQNDSFELVERIDGYVDVSGGAPEYFKPVDQWPLIQQKAIQYAKGKVLDVGAGAGRVSLYLQEQNHEVLAIDNSPLALEICRKRGVKNTQLLLFKDVDQLAPQVFDTLVLFGNNFGLFESPAIAKALLKNLHAITSPDAMILAESNDPYLTDKPAHLAYQKANRKQGRLPGQLKIRIRFEAYIGEWFDYLIVSEAEMRAILEGTGWEIWEIIQESGKSPYVAVITKEKPV